MNENLNLVEILKDCPKWTKLYSSLFGEVKFNEIKEGPNYPVHFITNEGLIVGVSSDGKYYKSYNGECILFPSKEQRDWSKFKPKMSKFDPKTLQPFDKVLARICDGDAYCWFADFVSLPATVYDRIPCIMRNKDCNMVIPYNEETKHLVGTTDEAPEYYRYWED